LKAASNEEYCTELSRTGRYKQSFLGEKIVAGKYIGEVLVSLNKEEDWP
jgi:hypothetical protein